MIFWNGRPYMSDYVAETPDLSEAWCPTCQPDRDPAREILQVRYCFMHHPADMGSADSMVTPPEFSNWSAPGEAGGEDNRRLNDVLRGEFWSNR